MNKSAHPESTQCLTSIKVSNPKSQLNNTQDIVKHMKQGPLPPL